MSTSARARSATLMSMLLALKWDSGTKTPDATERSYSAAQREGWARVAGYVEKHYHTPLSPSGTAEMRHAALPELPPWPRSEWIEKDAYRTFWESERSISEWGALTFKPMVDARDARIAELERDNSEEQSQRRIAMRQIIANVGRITALEAALRRAKRDHAGADACSSYSVLYANSKNAPCSCGANEHNAAIDAALAKGETGCKGASPERWATEEAQPRQAAESKSVSVSPALTVDGNDGQPCVVPNSDEARKRQVERAARTAKPSRDEAYAALYRVLIDTANIHPTSRAYMLVDAVLAGLGVALGAERLFPKVASADDVAALVHAPVLGRLPVTPRVKSVPALQIPQADPVAGRRVEATDEEALHQRAHGASAGAVLEPDALARRAVHCDLPVPRSGWPPARDGSLPRPPGRHPRGRVPPR